MPTPPTRKLVTPATARNAALINQLATPGLGSLLAGRRLAGLGQLTLAVAGFVLVILWFLSVLRQFYGMVEGSVEIKPVGWIGLAGAGLFAAAWVWSLVTSIGLIREAHRHRTTLFNQPQPPPLP